MKFRRRPVVIDAERWDGGERDFLVVNRGDRAAVVETAAGHRMRVPAGHALIATLEGPHLVAPGDWIVTGVKGERYAVKPDVFELTYEPAT